MTKIGSRLSRMAKKALYQKTTFKWNHTGRLQGLMNIRRFGSIDVHRCGRNRKVGGKEKDTVLVQSCGKKFFLRASFCVLRELIFAIFFKSRRNHWWYFRFYWVRAMEIHIFKHTTVCAPFVKPVQQIITLLLYSMNRSGRLLNYFWIFRVGDYSRWALIRGWVLIKSPFSASVVCLFCNKTINGNNKTRRCNKTEFL